MSALVALLLAQLALPPGGLVYPLGGGPGAPGAVYQLGPVASGPDLLWAPPTPAAPAVPVDALAYWRMNEDGGPPVDALGGVVSTAYFGTVLGANGVFDGASWYRGNTSSGSPSGVCTSGPAPGALRTALLSGGYTLSAWVYRQPQTDAQTYEDILVVSDSSFRAVLGWSLEWSSGAQNLYWMTASPSTYEGYLSSATVTPGLGWTHLAVTVAPADGGTRTVTWYQNGAEGGTRTGWAPPSNNGTTSTVYIGCAENGYWAWSGALDELRIDGHAWTAAEVLADYQASGRWADPPPSSRGPALEHTRSSTATYETQPGHVVHARSGELRCGQSGCLVEPARTNLLLYSADVGGTGWTLSTNTLTRGIQAPDGSATGTRLTVASSTGNSYQFVTATSGPHVASAWLRPGTGDPALGLQCWGGGAPTTCTCSTTAGACTPVLGSDCTVTLTGTTTWARVAVGLTCPASTASISMSVGPSSFTGGVGKYADIWGAQVEAGDYLTSYVPTSGTAATRAADTLWVSGSLTALGRSLSVREVLVPLWASAGRDAELVRGDPADVDLHLSAGALTWSVNGSDLLASPDPAWAAGDVVTLDAWASGAAGGSWRVTDGTSQATGASPGTVPLDYLYLGGALGAGAGVALQRVSVCARGVVCQ